MKITGHCCNRVSRLDFRTFYVFLYNANARRFKFFLRRFPSCGSQKMLKKSGDLLAVKPIAFWQVQTVARWCICSCKQRGLQNIPGLVMVAGKERRNVQPCKICWSFRLFCLITRGLRRFVSYSVLTRPGAKCGSLAPMVLWISQNLQFEVAFDEYGYSIACAPMRSHEK